MRKMNLRSLQYGFPRLTIEPGQEVEAKVAVRGWFRAQKLIMFGSMKPIRGNFRIKRTRRGWLDRDLVYAYSTLRRWSNSRKRRLLPGRTYVVYSKDGERFERDYLPESIIYKPTDPLEYIRLKQLQCGSEPTISTFDGGVPGVPGMIFGAESFGIDIPSPSTNVSVTICLKNDGDVQVVVNAVVMGYGEWIVQKDRGGEA